MRPKLLYEDQDVKLEEVEGLLALEVKRPLGKRLLLKREQAKMVLAALVIYVAESTLQPPLPEQGNLAPRARGEGGVSNTALLGEGGVDGGLSSCRKCGSPLVTDFEESVGYCLMCYSKRLREWEASDP